jgi:hypothetical protein
MCILGFDPDPPQIASTGTEPDDPQVTLQDGPWNITSGQVAVRQETGCLKIVAQDPMIPLKRNVSIDGTGVPLLEGITEQGSCGRFTRIIPASP